MFFAVCTRAPALHAVVYIFLNCLIFYDKIHQHFLVTAANCRRFVRVLF